MSNQEEHEHLVRNEGRDAEIALHAETLKEDHDRLVKMETILDLLRAQLLGNGQPGRCARESTRLSALERWQARIMGALAALALLAPLAGALLAKLWR